MAWVMKSGKAGTPRLEFEHNSYLQISHYWASRVAEACRSPSHLPPSRGLLEQMASSWVVEVAMEGCKRSTTCSWHYLIPETFIAPENGWLEDSFCGHMFIK